MCMSACSWQHVGAGACLYVYVFVCVRIELGWSCFVVHMCVCDEGVPWPVAQTVPAAARLIQLCVAERHSHGHYHVSGEVS